MSLQSPHSSKIPAVGTHVPVVIPREDARSSTHFSARGSSRGAASESASMPHRPHRSPSSMTTRAGRASPACRSGLHAARTRNGREAEFTQCPCHLRAPCPLSLKPTWVDAQGPCASTHRSRRRRSSTARTRGTLDEFVCERRANRFQSSRAPRYWPKPRVEHLDGVTDWSISRLSWRGVGL